jgi:hypothetical protein
MLIGERSGYWVIQWSYDWDPSLVHLLSVVPEIALGKRVAITSCDSGPYRLCPEDLAGGWTIEEDTSLSPAVNTIDDLPTPGFDEWYVYNEVPTIYPKKNFVNRLGFSPLDMDSEETNTFWSQIEEVQPLHALGAGTPNMFFATRDKATFERVKRFNTSLETHAARGSA